VPDIVAGAKAKGSDGLLIADHSRQALPGCEKAIRD